jgi:D-alanyl-D-alanine carboxypeptidase
MRIQNRFLRLAAWSFAALACAAAQARATPFIVLDAASGRVVLEQESTHRWYPASLTKLMTLYVALTAVREKRVTLDTPIVVSMRAARMPASKMGFNPGSEVTLDNALKMLMVKSANDIAVTIAEGLGGSVEGFSDQMNAAAARLGMNESHFVNPNGLHNDNHYSSARDMAIVGRALFRDFPEYADYYGIGALRLGPQIIPTHNGLLGRYPGADGMKTGFTCPAGFNVVASATRGGRRLIVVVLGYPNAKARTLKTASLLDAGFASGSGSTPIATLAAAPGPAPNMRPRVCGAHRAQVSEDDFAVVPVAQRPGERDHNRIFFGATGAGAPVNGLAATQEQMHTRPSFEPVDVYVGRAPGWTGPVLAARGDGPRPDASAAAQPAAKATVAKAKGKHLAKGKKAAKKKPAPKAKVEAKPSPPARPKTAQH